MSPDVLCGNWCQNTTPNLSLQQQVHTSRDNSMIKYG
jgi:hypothetical protein